MRGKTWIAIGLISMWLSACGGGGGSSDGTTATAPNSSGASSPATQSIIIPRGAFASAGSTNTSVVNHAQVKGVLVRVPWSTIEPAAGIYDFSSIDNQIALLKSAGKGWSLGVVAGPSSPSWLYASPYNVTPLYITFRGSSTQVPQFWNTALQQRLTALAQALAAHYGSDDSLRLVYLPQMSANGIEGHFNGNTDTSLTSQGFTEDLWVDAVLQGARSFASAFSTKPVAIELHYILGSANAGKRIMQTIEADNALLNQVGVALWWISGKTDYQADLLTAFGTFKGSIYAQLIDKSVNASSFLNNDYSTAFTQAKSLHIKYIEPWDVDFTSHAWDSLFADFNTYSQQ